MNGGEKGKIKEMLGRDITRIHNQCTDIKRTINENLAQTIDYLNLLFSQIPQSVSGPLIAKTPKVKRSKVQRIETIPEDDVVEVDCTMSNSIATSMRSATEEADVLPAGRAKRKASVKAINNIREQQSMSLLAKLRRPSDMPDLYQKGKRKRESNKTKRENVVGQSSDDEAVSVPRKHSRRDDDGAAKDATTDKLLTPKVENRRSRDDTLKSSPLSLRKSKTRSSARVSQDEAAEIKRSRIIDDTVIAPVAVEEDMEEPSMYEDALAKPTPIMNSTMNLNSTAVIQKMMNATVVLEALPVSRLNETVTLKKQSLKGDGRRTRSRDAAKPSGSSPTRKALQDRMQQIKAAMANKEFDDLITDDESSPELKKRKALLKKTQEERKRQRQRKRISSTSDEDEEDEVMNTPAKKKPLREVNAAVLQESRTTGYKKNALFSPYAKESVKKRVEAFEQAGLNSPTTQNAAVDPDVPTRITRTKTRAIAAAKGAAAETAKDQEKTVAQKLARKSLARAKKISLARLTKDTDDYKENAIQSAQKTNKVIPVDKVTQSKQAKITPLAKTKMLPPMSVSRIPQTPSNQTTNNQTRALSAVRGNVVSNVESFIQPPKIVTKAASVDKMEERRRKLHEEDARRKREEALRLQTEEKRRKRQEKELKNKLAREAKERQELEKRQRAEREREEKARLAQQMQEKQREEMERKRLLQLQRTQEKEERRKLEEQLRLQRLQEQEEAERLLAEQKRREQEAEKRREAEARSQQQAAAEAARVKNQILQAQAKQNKQNHGPTNYVLDSEPDDDESDDESRPKHTIPHWAQPHVRKGHLMMQRYIPEKAVFKFFDTRKCTPDLTELFQGIDRRKLKRTSSAVWKTPPRYSMMNLPE